MQEISLKHDLSSLGQAININALNNWEASVNEYLADLQAGIEELNNAAPPSTSFSYKIQDSILVALLCQEALPVGDKSLVYALASDKGAGDFDGTPTSGKSMLKLATFERTRIFTSVAGLDFDNDAEGYSGGMEYNKRT